MPRIHCPGPLGAGTVLALSGSPARHVQVLRLQPGDALTLFDGRGGEYDARVRRMGRSDVEIAIGAHRPLERETPRALHIACGMPANERMDWLVEKATELGCASIQPLATTHGVLRLAGERAEKKRAHWQAIAIAACEQSGRNRVPPVQAVAPLAEWLATGCGETSGDIDSDDEGAAGEAAAAHPARLVHPARPARLVLSLRDDAAPFAHWLARATPNASATLLSGPEGGLAPHEEDAARAAGFEPVRLGPSVLRAETAPLAALAMALATL